jgi:hypothetical protein
MGVTLAELLNGVLQGASPVVSILEAFVKADHKFGSAAVVDIPQAQQERPSARMEQPANQSEQFIPCGHDIHARGTAA